MVIATSTWYVYIQFGKRYIHPSKYVQQLGVPCGVHSHNDDLYFQVLHIFARATFIFKNNYFSFKMVN